MIDKFKLFVKNKIMVYVIIGAAAVGILIFLPDASNQKPSGTGDDKTVQYINQLENKITDLIVKIDGVRDCTAAITLSLGYEYLYASDGKLIRTYNPEGGILTEDEQRQYVKNQADGDEVGMILHEKMPVVEGVAVVCPGINGVTKQKIIEMLTALFNIKSNKISVIS